MKTILMFICAISMAISTHANAGSPSFTYVELEYVASGDFEITDGNLSVDTDLDGYALTGSLELGIFFIQASRFELETDNFLNGSLEDSISTLALGFTFELPATQIYALVRARRDELSVNAFGFSEEDDLGVVGAEVGARINLTDRFEVNANVGRPSADEGSSFGLGAQFFVTNNIGLTLDYTSLELEDDGIEASFDTTSLGIRYTF